MGEDIRKSDLLEGFDAIDAVESDMAPLHRSLRVYFGVWLASSAGLGAAAMGGGLGYVLSWIVGPTLVTGLISLPSLLQLRVLKKERDQLLLAIEETSN